MFRVSTPWAWLVAGPLALLSTALFDAAFVVAKDAKSKIPADVLSLVDPQARYRPTPLSAEDDGFRLLEELQKLTVVEPRSSNDGELYDAYRAVIGGERPFPGGEQGVRLRKLFEDNVRGLRLVEQFAQHRGVRFPDLLKVSDSQPRKILSVRRLQIAWLQSQRQFEAVTQMLFEQLHIAEMLQDSEGGLLTWLVGSNIEEGVLHSFARLAADPEFPAEQLIAWQKRTEKLRERSTESLVQCLRRDYCEVELPLYAGLPADATLERAVAAAVNRMRPKTPQFWVDLRFTLREWQVLALLSKHPTPFDRDETIRLSSQCVAELIRVLKDDRSQPLTLQAEEISHVTQVWPESMGLTVLSLFPLHWGGPEWDSWKSFWNEIQTAVEASEQLAEIPNVFGKYLIAIHRELDSDNSLASYVVRHRVRVQATLAMLAIRRFERSHQKLPKSLQVLVDVKLLAELPIDPIDGQPLRYDPARRLLWSIGPDGIDDGGIQRPQDSVKFLAMFRKLLPKNNVKQLPKLPELENKTAADRSDIVFSLDAK